MAFTSDELRSLFGTREFKVSFFPADRWLTDMWSFMIEDIMAGEDDRGITLSLTFPREQGVEEFLDAWSNTPSGKDDPACGPRDIVIIGQSSVESPAVLRIARFSSATPVSEKTDITDNAISVYFACESAEEDFRGYAGKGGTGR